MRGDPQVIALLNDLLSVELTAVHQYALHARICENWGYERLFEKLRDETRDELGHAERLIERILYLDGDADVQRLGTVAAGTSVQDQLTMDHALESGAAGAYNRGIALCRKVGDNGTAELLEDLLEDTEDHVNWLESQLALVRQIGLERYLSEQLRGGGTS